MRDGGGFNREKRTERSHSALALSWLAVIAWCCFIFFMSARTATDLGGSMGVFSWVYQQLDAWQEGLFGPDADVINPLAHFFEYAVLGVLLANALSKSLPSGGKGTRAIVAWVVQGSIVLASLYGATDELHQSFTPGRVCDVADWLVDTAGATLGAVAFVCLRR